MARILAVDDDPEVLRVIALALKPAGHEVRIAASGRAFISAYEEFLPEVVLIDVIMPDLGGTDLLRWLATRQQPARIVVMTGDPQSVGNLAPPPGARGLHGRIVLLSKPFKLSELRAAIDTHRG